MKIYTYFKPDDVVYQIALGPSTEPKTIEFPCSVCNGKGKIQDIYVCGKCFGSKKDTKTTHVPIEPTWNLVAQERIVALDVHVKKNESKEYLFKEYTDESFHRLYDRSHATVNAMIHTCHAPGNTFHDPSDVKKLNSNIQPERKLSPRLDTKFNLDDKVFTLFEENTNFKKCSLCKGKGEISLSGYTHVCKKCKGKGTQEYKDPRYAISSGIIVEIQADFRSESTRTFYSVHCIDGIHHVLEEDLISTNESELIKIAELGFKRKVKSIY